MEATAIKIMLEQEKVSRALSEARALKTMLVVATTSKTVPMETAIRTMVVVTSVDSLTPSLLVLPVEVDGTDGLNFGGGGKGKSLVVEMGARGKIVVGANIDVHRL